MLTTRPLHILRRSKGSISTTSAIYWPSLCRSGQLTNCAGRAWTHTLAARFNSLRPPHGHSCSSRPHWRMSRTCSSAPCSSGCCLFVTCTFGSSATISRCASVMLTTVCGFGGLSKPPRGPWNNNTLLTQPEFSCSLQARFGHRRLLFLLLLGGTSTLISSPPIYYDTHLHFGWQMNKAENKI